ALHPLPDGVAVRLDDHAAADVGVLGKSGALDDVEIPLRVVVGPFGDLFGHVAFLAWGWAKHRDYREGVGAPQSRSGGDRVPENRHGTGAGGSVRGLSGLANLAEAVIMQEVWWV